MMTGQTQPAAAGLVFQTVQRRLSKVFLSPALEGKHSHETLNFL